MERVNFLMALVAFAAAAHDGTQEQHQRRRNLIIHGEIAEEGRYPYFATLDHNCGGALVASDVVITAGHCKEKWLAAAVGRYSFVDDDESDSSSSFAGYYDVIAEARHPLWVRKGDDEFENDFLLLKLNQTLPGHPIAHLNKNTTLPNVTDSSNGEVIAMGVGWTHSNRESKSDTLREVKLNAISNEECRASSTKHLSYEKRIFSSHLCTTGGEHNDRDACAYDSGSPIIIPGEDGAPDVIVALVSWGEKCADPDFPGVNARVSDAFEWLRVNICVMSDDPPDYLCAPPAPAKPAPSVGEPVHVVDIMWKIATVFLGILCSALLCERSRRTHQSSSMARKQQLLDSPGSSIDELEVLNADGPHLNRYESLKGVEVSTFTSAA